uniref:hypothetical protein n=1 Tax=Sphingomonas bacterium TaxID=1895847 RepID=UPI002615F160|nr:hypothetical protein [Sphingomonas bacterium]
MLMHSLEPQLYDGRIRPQSEEHAVLVSSGQNAAQNTLRLIIRENGKDSSGREGVSDLYANPGTTALALWGTPSPPDLPNSLRIAATP